MDSPYASILHTNTVPSDTQYKRILELLVRPCKEAADLSEEIQRLQRKLNGLNDFIEAHRALVSPARRLPDDVVQEIFQASLPPLNSSMSGKESPLLLCHICRAWRHLALHTPTLWTSLHIAAPSAGNHSAFVKKNNIVNAWLSRSGSLPLSISCNIVSSTFGIMTEAYITMILETLVRYSRRWQHVRFVLPNYTVFLPLATLNAKDVPMLQSMSIKGFTHQPSDPDWESVSFINTPTLRSASFAYDSAHLLQVPICWGQLLHLSLRVDAQSFRPIAGAQPVISTAEVFTILAQCALLETFAFTIPLPVPHQLPSVICRMEHLRQLYVSGGNPRTAPPFFSRLELPVLRRLEFHGSTSSRGPLPFLPILASTNLLESLGLNVHEMTAARLIECLRLVPALQELQLIDDPKPSVDPTRGARLDPISGRMLLPEDRHSIIAMLTPRPDDTGPVLCPRLRRVMLQRFRLVADKVLLEFIRARAGTLSNFRAALLRGKEIDIIPHVQDLIANGLKVSLEYTPISLFTRPSTPAVPNDADWRPLSLDW
ncbi:hypothetical protein C8J57DRAFT_1390740 [Mycena rebaudengoi]|nr:hypothetical protein C8J57DRAFT_1390740 [Mycena rebaudengoi]